MENCIIEIASGGYRQQPAVLEGIQWKTKRKGEAATLTFTCIKDKLLSFPEGAEVTFQYGNKNVFSGYVFQKHRTKDQHIEVTCYDRTRYFKTKENYVFTGLRADQIITRIAMDMGIKIGHISNTGYVIPKFAKSDTTMWDIIQEALDLTMMETKVRYTMYDDFGKLCVKSQAEMYTDYLLDMDVAEDFDYTTSIDQNTYNRIVVKVPDGAPVIVEAQPTRDANGKRIPSTIEQWGLLQHVTDVQNAENALVKAQALLEIHNHVGCSLGVSGAFGDINVRAGSSVYLDMNLGDNHGNLHQMMIVDEVTHTFDNNDHYMDLTLKDGDKFYDED